MRNILFLHRFGEAIEIRKYLDIVILDGYYLLVADCGVFLFSVAFGDDDIRSVVLEDPVVSILDKFEVERLGFILLFDGKIVDSEFDSLRLPFVSFHLNEVSIDQIEFIVVRMGFLDD